MSLSLWSEVDNDARKFRSFRGQIIVLEGLIGVGKTTLGHSLETYFKKIGLKARFFPEFKNEQLLGQYINDMDKYSYTFQIAMLMARIETYQQAHEFSEQGGISIIDRSLPGDYTFASMQKSKGRFTKDEWQVYNSLIPRGLPEPNCIVMLECSPENAFKRMQKRGELAEVSGYTLEYFQELDTHYQETFLQINHPIVSINWNVDRQLHGVKHRVCKADYQVPNGKLNGHSKALDVNDCQTVLHIIWQKLYT